MIIGFCGLAGSGKDTAADVLVERGQATKIALADPIKRICQMMLGFTDEQLWGPSENRNKPDKRLWSLPISEEAIENLTEAWHATYEPNAPDNNGPSLREYLGLTEDEYKYYVEVGGYLTPRQALQLLGTEWGRRCYPNMWVDRAIKDAKTLLETTREDNQWKEGPPGFHTLRYSPQKGIWNAEGPPQQNTHVFVSDVRFLNEVMAINAAGGRVYKLLRGHGLTGTAGLHKSETEMAQIPKELFAGIIDNREWSLDRLKGYLSDNIGRDN